MKRRTLGLLLAVCLAVGLLAPAGAAEASGARVLLEAGKPDADGCFTVAMRIYNAAFNAFQFVLWYDGDTVRPVDASGQETQRFSAFAQPEDDGWMATIGHRHRSGKGTDRFHRLCNAGAGRGGGRPAADGRGRCGGGRPGPVHLPLSKDGDGPGR